MPRSAVQSVSDRAPIRLPANEIDAAVSNAVVQFLRDRRLLLGRIGNDLQRAEVSSVLVRAEKLAEQVLAARGGKSPSLRALLRKVEYREQALQIELDGRALRVSLNLPLPSNSHGTNDTGVENVGRHSPLIARRRGRQLKLVLGDGATQREIDHSLVTAISRAHCWAQSLVTGEVGSLTEIARNEGVALTYVAQLLPLGFLSPAKVGGILSGQHPPDLTADWLVRHEKVQLRWSTWMELRVSS